MLAAWIAVLWVWSSIAPAQTQPANNPHWSKTGCDTCHAGKPGPIAASAVTALCLSCHDGKHASDEAHPVGRAMQAIMTNPGWPTVDGTVQCLTCHNVKQQCDVNAERTDDNAAFLRSSTDPKTPFCANCHKEPKLTRFNPHMMVQADTHAVITERCDVCHDKPMDPRATQRTGNASLRADQVTLCKSCHPHHKDISPMGHVQTTIPNDMLLYMRAREITGLLDSPSPDLLAQLEKQNAKPELMVPDADGRIVCTTCHNPHEQGTFARGSVLDDRSLRLMKGHLVTSTRGELFCRHCHKV